MAVMAFPYVAPTPVKGVTEEEILDALDKAAKDFAEQGNNLMEKKRDDTSITGANLYPITKANMYEYRKKVWISRRMVII